MSYKTLTQLIDAKSKELGISRQTLCLRVFQNSLLYEREMRREERLAINIAKIEVYDGVNPAPPAADQGESVGRRFESCTAHHFFLVISDIYEKSNFSHMKSLIAV